MTKKRRTRRALINSVISLLICFSMLLGTTFAWFTDTVNSGMNQIVAGNLDVDLEYELADGSYESVEEVNTLFDFNDKGSLWEPGVVAYENLKVVNKGNLALEYQMALNFTNATKTPNGGTLADVLKVAVVEGGFNGDRTAAHALDYNYNLSTFALKGELEANQSSDVYGIVIYWQPTDYDNEYNMNNENQGKVLSIDLGMNLFATQLEYEEDSFDNTYDEDASLEIPDVEVNTASALWTALAAGQKVKLTEDLALTDSGVIPFGVESVLDLNGYELTTNGNGATVKGTLTIMGNGSIIAADGDDDLNTPFEIGNGGTLIIQDGTISANEDNAIAILYDGSNFNMTGGSIISNSEQAIFVMGDDVTVNLADGSIKVPNGYAINAQGSTLDVFVGEDVIEQTSKYDIQITATTNLNLTYKGKMPTVGPDSTINNVTYNKATNYEGIYQSEINSKQYYVVNKEGLMNLNALLDDVSPSEAKIITVDLMSDIDLVGENWNPIDSMWIIFNGNNHTIKNIEAGFSVDGRRSGFWGYAGAVTINDLTLENVTVSGSQAGTFAGSGEGLTINNCFLKGDNTVNFTAGVETWNGIGAITGVLTNSTVNVTITEDATVTLNKGDMTTDAGCVYIDKLTGYISKNNGKVIPNGKVIATVETTVEDFAELEAAINQNDNVVVNLSAGEYTLPSLAAKEGTTIIGEEGTVIGGETSSTGFGSNFGKDTTIKNITFSGNTNGVRWSYANGGSTEFENCTFAGDSTYGFHIDQSNGATFTFTDCTFVGFNAFAGDLEKVIFNNCTFLNNGNYGHTNIWSVAEFNDCTWGDSTSVSGGKLYFDGTEESYHHEFIGTAESLVAFAESVNIGGDSWKGQKVTLVDDIDLVGIDWKPIGQTGKTEFKGIFDGGNHTIYNLTVDSTAETGGHYSSGLFGWIESHDQDITIKNVNVNEAIINGHHNCGVIVGYATGDALIENCHVINATVRCTVANEDANGDKAGVIVGNATAEVTTKVTNCSAKDSTVSAGRDAGQIAGAAKATNLTGCTVINVTVTNNGTGTGANIRENLVGREL